MPVTTTPKGASFREETRLLNGITPASTDIVCAPIYKYVSGVRTKQGLDSTIGFGVIIQGDKVERFSFASASVNSDNETTLTDLRRGLSQTINTANPAALAAGTGLDFSRGATIIISNDPYYFLAAVYTDIANTFSETQTFNKGIQGIVVADTTARDALFPSPTNGLQGIYVASIGGIQDYVGGAWQTRGTASILSATESVEGKVELATVAEHDRTTTGARVIQAKNVLSDYFIYTPAFLTGGTNVTPFGATWTGVTNGSVRITIDGVQRDITGLNFSGAADMPAIATIIQTGIRAATGALETCVWSTNRFIVSSVNTTVSSAITVASAVGSGTDISGAGATNYMDCDTGNGVVTNAVINEAAHSKYVLTLNSVGKIPLSLLAGGVPSGSMFQWLTDTAPTGYLLCYGQAVSRTTYSALFAVISTTFGVGDGSTTFNLPDLRGRLPLGQDDMGGASANRVTASQADSIGGVNGAESVNLAHTHTVAPTSSITAPNGSGHSVLPAGGIATSSALTTTNVMNPYITVNYIIKT